MSEEPTNPDEMQGAEFDAQRAMQEEVDAVAAQKAKNLLDEASRNNDGMIIDREHSPLDYSAEAHASAYKVAEMKKDDAWQKVGETVAHRDSIWSAAKALDESDGDHTESIRVLGAEADKVNKEITQHNKDYETAESQIDSSLWRASQHLQNNNAEYKAAAIEEANAAGYDVNYEGINYPANQTEQPRAEQPRQQDVA